MNSVGMLLDWAESLSSKVRMKRLLCVAAHWMYASRWILNHSSPVAIVPECMLWIRSGITTDTVGRAPNRSGVGKSVNGRLLVGGTFEKLDHGLWRRR